jgi:hypothetical protein
MHVMVAWWVLIGHFPLYPTVQPIPFLPLALYRLLGRDFLTLNKRASETSLSIYSPTRCQNPEYIYQYRTREPGMLPAYMWDVPNSNPSHYTDYIKVFLFFICSGLPDTFCGAISNYVTTYFLYIISYSLVTVILLF